MITKYQNMPPKNTGRVKSLPGMFFGSLDKKNLRINGDAFRPEKISVFLTRLNNENDKNKKNIYIDSGGFSSNTKIILDKTIVDGVYKIKADINIGKKSNISMDFVGKFKVEFLPQNTQLNIKISNKMKKQSKLKKEDVLKHCESEKNTALSADQKPRVKKFKITSDGTSGNTIVTYDGEMLKGVKKACFEIEVNDVAKLSLWMNLSQSEVEVLAKDTNLNINLIKEE